MDLTHRFSVPASPEEAWTAFANLERLAPCFPGAAITSIDGDDFAGTVKIKLGPIALVYTGTGKYVERDRDSARMVIEARGRDKRGNGTATAIVAATFSANGDRTDVEVQTDLSITGKPAQFGRGVISDVSDKLLDQFVSCVSGRFTEGLGEPDPPTGPEGLAEAGATAETGPTVQLGETPGPVVDLEPGPERATDAPPTAAQPGPTQPGPTQPGPTHYVPPSNVAEPDFNVVATVLPVLLKRYWPVLGGAVAALFVISKVMRRTRR